LEIRTKYKLWFLSKIVPLETHSFVTRKKNKHKEKMYLGITTKTKHSKKSLNDSNDDEFTFSPKEKNNDWEKLDNQQESIQNKTNKQNNNNKDFEGSGTIKISSVIEINSQEFPNGII
jgi:hypothetical protein